MDALVESPHLPQFHDIVFDPRSKLPWNVDHWLNTEHHIVREIG